MRFNNLETNYLSEAINVYKFYFDDVLYNLKQRKQTLHLAMTYFTQTVMRCPCLQKSEIGIIAASALLLASKFDEIDYSLPSINKIRREMDRSVYFRWYDKDFYQWNFISWEREIWKRLDWNFNQLTPYHYFESLINQGIFKTNGALDLNDAEPHLTHLNSATPKSAFSMYPLNFKRSREAESGSLSRKNSRGKLIKWYYFKIKWNK